MRKKGDRDDTSGSDRDGDGICAIKVMRKNHVDYIKAGRDILTKVMQPSIVQLSYSFPAIFFNVTWIQR